MSNQRVIYSQLLDEHRLIQIPMIQRDYAQGRESAEDVREQFLAAIYEALHTPEGDPSLPLNLDFIYGSVEGERGESKFSPLDGQQRLTTLFLLHWYLAWQDEEWDAFDALFLLNGISRFTYRIRPSSSEFFDFLVVFHPDIPATEFETVSDLIKDQPGYFRNWRLDPTIQSALVMLDAIHVRFVECDGLFQRLIDRENPAITFQLLPLDKFGLSDDLYIKMNARGMPLTPFETFKARYEQELKNQFEGKTRSIGTHEFPIHEYVSRRMDTAWMDMFWTETKKTTNRSTEVDRAILNVFRVVALITRDPESDECLSSIQPLTTTLPDYSVFHKHNWLDEEFTLTLIPLLEAWSGGGGGFHTLLPNSSYFDEKRVFAKMKANSASLEVTDILQFKAYAYFIRTHESDIDADVFQEWMRVVHNLVVNSTNIDRSDRLPGGMKGIACLLPESRTILEYLASIDPKRNVGTFFSRQVQEEALKASLLIHHPDWRELIDRAELHNYFRGQIEFLLKFSGTLDAAVDSAVSDWDVSKHLQCQADFEDFLKVGEAMFTNTGVENSSGDFLWQRALLSVGDYLFPMTAHRYNFLLNSHTEVNSWKRLLRGSTPEESRGRQLLNRLWDQLDSDEPFIPQLQQLVNDASNLEPWRKALLDSPEAMSYCNMRIIRREFDNNVYLLSKAQMNGAHAELFTYRLYCRTLSAMKKEGKLAPLKLDYFFARDRDFEPGVQFSWDYDGRSLRFGVKWRAGKFILFIGIDELDGLDALSQDLVESLGLEVYDKFLRKTVLESEILIEIDALVCFVRSLNK